MKKLITFALTLALVCSMTVPASAVTPDSDTPSISIPDISDDVHVELPDGTFDDYIPDVEIEPTESPAEENPDVSTWHDWICGWFKWWINKFH